MASESKIKWMVGNLAVEPDGMVACLLPDGTSVKVYDELEAIVSNEKDLQRYVKECHRTIDKLKADTEFLGAHVAFLEADRKKSLDIIAALVSRLPKE